MEVFKILYTVLGGLGIFFFGMKLMSESLQASASDVIKKVIRSLTSNRFLAVLVGIIVTAIVQSSSVTTVMVIGFINAGLMTLLQGIGVIFGANIGTTITGWIISIKIGKYGLLLIGLGVFPALFSKKDSWKQIGYIILGIGLIFFGLDIMSDAFKPLRSMPQFMAAINYFAGSNYSAYIASALMGALLTAIIQSSSAMLGIVISMTSTGILDYNAAVAIILGTNIGTTITAVLASVGANVHARRAAKAHAFFNIFGVILIMTIFPYFLELIDSLIPGNPMYRNEAGDAVYAAVHLATAHTMFNVIATIAALPFVKQLAAFVTKITPDRSIKEQHHLVMLGSASEILPATAIVQAFSELKRMNDIVDRMFLKSREYLAQEVNDARLFAKIKDYERITDNIQKEVTVFMCKVMEKPLSSKQSHEAQAIVRIADELESVGDYLDKLVTYKTKFSNEAKLSGGSLTDIVGLFDQVEDFYHSVHKGLNNPETFDLSISTRKMEELRLLCDSILDAHMLRVANGEYTALTAMTYSDMVSSLKKVRSHVYNITQSISMSEKRDF